MVSDSYAGARSTGPWRRVIDRVTVQGIFVGSIVFIGMTGFTTALTILLGRGA